jgi:hypothetical protein
MKTVTIRASKTYDITIGKGLLGNVGNYVAVVTDNTVASLYGRHVPCRQISYTSEACRTTIAGKGFEGYREAINKLIGG